MKKGKQIKRVCLSILLTTALTVTSLIPYASKVTADDEISQYEVIKVSPGNMLNVQVVDEDGNQIDNISASLKDSTGSTAASWVMGSQEITPAQGYNITGNKRFEVQMNEYVSPWPLMYAITIDNWRVYSSGKIPFEFDNDELSKQNIRLDYMKNDYPTDLTVPKDNYAVVVDSEYENQNYNPYYMIKGEEHSLSDDAGKTIFFDMSNQTNTSVKWKWNENVESGISSWNKIYSVEGEDEFVHVRNTDTEYIKMHIKLKETIGRFGEFNDAGMVKGNDGSYYSVSDANVHLAIISGSVINFPMPDENGYVDIYVEKSTRATCGGVYVYKNGSSNLNCSAYDYEIYNFQTPEFPDKGTTLTYVPAGEYTLELSNIPEQYKQPAAKSVTVAESKDVQLLKVVLEDMPPHVHTADESSWLNDVSEHWHKCSTCDEDVKLDKAVHVPGAAATETSPQTCTVCGYEIAPRLEHVHDYGNTYKTDTENHWKECRCGDISEKSDHNFEWVTDSEATATEDRIKHEECKVCGYKKEAVTEHVHAYGDVYKTDAENHWKECRCGDVSEKSVHDFEWVTDSEATATEDGIKHEECTVCGYKKEAVTEHVHTYGDVYKTDTENHWKECRCGDVSEKSAHNFEWVTDKEATEGVAGSKHEECTVCGYKKEAVEIPALKPTEQPIKQPEPDTEKPTQEQTTKNQETPTQQQTTQKQNTPVTGDNISSSLLILIITSIVLFGIVAVIGKKKEVSEN